MKHLDLFSGIGGFALAAKWAGIETVAFCEIDDSCKIVLKKHWPEIPIHNDIKELDGAEYAGVDIITGGYPCQPFSVAGSQKAQGDDRHLWPEMFRVITQAKPDWVVCENVHGHIRLGLDEVLHDLEGVGYSCQSLVIPALATGANHNRRRVFVVAYAAGNGRHEGEVAGGYGKADGDRKKREDENSHDEGCSSVRAGVDWSSGKAGSRGVKPPAIRVDDGIPDRMDRIKMIGNSIDPQIAYEILHSIKTTKKGE